MSKYNMQPEEIRTLTEIKKLVRQGKRYFFPRKDRNYMEDLSNLEITVEEAWNHILTLNSNFYFPDTKPNYFENTDGLVFKKQINGKIAYIKLRINEDRVEAECWSFHEDGK